MTSHTSKDRSATGGGGDGGSSDAISSHQSPASIYDAPHPVNSNPTDSHQPLASSKDITEKVRCVIPKFSINKSN